MTVVFNSIVTTKLPLNKTRVKKWIASVIKKEKLKEGQLAYTFCSDKDLLKINKEFLNHDTLTDIVTFDYSEHELISGEIYISADRVKENAEKFGVAFEAELRRVIIHGVLHLCGYGDKTKAEKKLMREKEDAALRSYSRMK
jgi:probable rRNA maturation factor